MYDIDIDNNESGLVFTLEPFSREKFEDGHDDYHRWMNDPDVTKFNSHGLFAKTEAEINEWLNDIENKRIICWMLCVNDEWIGTISLQSFNWIYRTAEVALWIGDINHWGKGLATEMVRLTCMHGFERLNLNRIWSGTAETNRGMQKAFERNGFRKEGVFRQGMFLSGRYADIFCYSILAKDWQEKDYAKEDRQ